jgi:hypothetical protein
MRRVFIHPSNPTAPKNSFNIQGNKYNASLMLQYGSTSAAPSVPSRSRRPLQKLLRLIDLGSQVWASPAIGVVQHHQGAVVLPDPLLGELALAISSNVSKNGST